MKILLINTGQYRSLKGNNYPLNAFQPAGLGYIASVLRDHNYKVEILDILAEGYDLEEKIGDDIYTGLSKKQIIKKIKKINPDVVGITIPFTNQARAGHEVAGLVKKIRHRIKVVVGGSYPTTYPEHVLRDPNIDFAVLGEGEITFLELVQTFSCKQKKYNLIKGLGYKDKKIYLNQKREALENLDKYSIAWDLFPMKKYFQAAKDVKSSRSISTYNKRWATVFTSRGCPYNCTFCVGHEVMGRKWRYRSVKNVISEMEYLITKYHIEHFDIEDDNFTLDKKRAKEICDKIIEKKWNIQWSTPNGIRADTVDEELILKMKQSGCMRTIVAPESGDQWVINKLMNKRINLNKIKQVVRWCRKYDLKVDAFFLLGMPGEKHANILKTISFAKILKKLGVNECLFGIVVPHKGTAVYEIAIKNNWLPSIRSDRDLVEKISYDEAFIETPYLSIKQLIELQKKANKSNSLIPFYRLGLIFRIAINSPKRFFNLLIADFSKRLGLIQGKTGV